MALSARISPRSMRGRCKCPSGTKKVFVGPSGVRCGKVKGSGDQRRFEFVRTPKSCNFIPQARSARRGSGAQCRYGRLKNPVGKRVCKKKSGGRR